MVSPSLEAERLACVASPAVAHMLYKPRTALLAVARAVSRVARRDMEVEAPPAAASADGAAPDGTAAEASSKGSKGSSLSGDTSAVGP